MLENRYADLEAILYQGFITLPLKVRGINFILKSVTDIEYQKIVLISGPKTPEYLYTYNFHINFLYHSIYLIDGSNFLKNRDDHYREFFKIIKSIPGRFINHIFKSLEKLAERQNKCTPLAEAYFFENTSRYNWIAKRGYLINDPTSTSIQGTENIGLNQFQKYWMVYNLREDAKESFEANYSLAKFLASFTDGKSVKKIEALDKNKSDEEKARRERIIEYGNDPEEYAKVHLSGPTDTADQLVESLNRQITGEKDRHDKAIEQYESSLREGMYKQMRDIKNMRDARVRDADVFSEEPSSISPEEMALRMQATARRPKYYLSDMESEDRTKYLEMSNVSDSDVIKKNNLMTKAEFNDLVSDELFEGKHNRIDIAEEEYLQQQKKLASLGDFSEDSNFPNLRKK